MHFVSHEIGKCYDALISCNERHNAKVIVYNFVEMITFKEMGVCFDVHV